MATATPDSAETPSGGGIRAMADAANPTFATVAVILPLGLAALAIFLENAPLLNAVHVLFGASWVGVSLFLPAIFSPVLGSLDPEARGAIAKRMTPKTLFALPPIVIATLVTGVELSFEYNYWDLDWVVFQAALVLGAIALLLGIGISWIQLSMYREITAPPPDPQRLGALAKRNLQFGVSIAVIQILIIATMGGLRSGLLS